MSKRESVFTIKIWGGETIYTCQGLPQGPEEIASKFGCVFKNVPLVLVQDKDGLTNEISSLSNFINKLGMDFPENYEEIAISPIKFYITEDKKIKYILNDYNQKLQEFLFKMSRYLPEYEEKCMLENRINSFLTSNLPIALAIEKGQGGGEISNYVKKTCPQLFLTTNND